MRNHDLLQIIIERVGASFYWDEVKNWPDGQLALFEKIGLLHQAQPMHVIDCDGCEETCPSMPVTIDPGREDRPARAYITCDKRDDIGRVKVEFDRLKQWLLTEMQLARFIADLCGFTQQVLKDGDFWRLGMIQGKKHNAQLLMRFENTQVFLKIAGHNITLLELILIDANQCRIDLKKLKDFADSPTGLADNKESAESRQDRLLARKRGLKSQGVTNFNQRIADEEGISLSQVKNLIKVAEKREKLIKNNPYNQLIKK